jgi:hypothetical protein
MTILKFANYGFCLILITLGVLNIIYIHLIPGVIYIAFTLLYFPPVTTWIYSKFKLKISSIIKFILGFILIWFTLGVSDLMEFFESKYL